MADKIYDVLIVGAGTAGLSAAIYALRSGKSVLVLEEKNVRRTDRCGLRRSRYYPGIAKISGFEFAQGLYEQAKNLGMEYETGKVTALKRGMQRWTLRSLRVAELSPDEEECSRDIFKVSVEQGGEQKLCRTRSVILATGARNRPLGLKNEREMIGHGVSYCATCDGMFFRGRKVAVAGRRQYGIGGCFVSCTVL